MPRVMSVCVALEGARCVDLDVAEAPDGFAGRGTRACKQEGGTCA